VVSVTNPYSRIVGFLDRSSYYFFQVAPQLYPKVKNLHKSSKGLESLSLVSTIEKLPGRKSRDSGLEIRDYSRRDPSR
jgi:hypothetical protein